MPKLPAILTRFISGRFLVGALAALALVTAAACSSDSESPTNPDNPNLVTIFIKNSAYSPNPARVKVGQFVNFKNDDGIEHNAVTTGGPVSFSTGNIPPNSAKDDNTLMSVAGTVTFHCTLHGETGSIIIE